LPSDAKPILTGVPVAAFDGPSKELADDWLELDGGEPVDDLLELLQAVTATAPLNKIANDERRSIPLITMVSLLKGPVSQGTVLDRHTTERSRKRWPTN
jgi:hypothetical protein